MKLRLSYTAALMLFSVLSFAQEQEVSIVKKGNQLTITDKKYIPVDTCSNEHYSPFSLYDVNGELVERKSVNEKPCLIYFIMQGCAPCSAEIPYINELYVELKNRVDFIIFANMTPESLKQYYSGEKHPLPPTIAIPERKEIDTYMVNRSGFPLCIIMNKQNNIKLIKRGGGTTKESGEKLVTLLRRHCLKAL